MPKIIEYVTNCRSDITKYNIKKRSNTVVLSSIKMTNRSIEQPSEKISYSLCNDGMTFVSMRPSNATGPSLSS